MNTRRCVHFASQDSVSLNSLAVLRLDNNELKSIDTYYRLAINNGVGHRFVLGCQTPDCYKGRGHARHRNDSNGFGKRVVGGIHFYQLQADEEPILWKTVILERLRSALKSKRSDSVSDQKLLIDIESLLALILSRSDGNLLLRYQKDKNVKLHRLTMLCPISFLGIGFNWTQ